MRKITSTAVAATAAILSLALAAPAGAATIEVKDPKDTSHGSDLRGVTVKHGPKNVIITTKHTNLRRDPKSGSGGAVYIDTDPSDKGPEFVFVGGYFVGTDYSLLHTEGFGHKRWGKAVEGSYRMTVDYQKETVRMRISRAALGAPQEVRVAVTASGTRTDGSSKGLTDWIGEPRSFTEWVARG